MANGKRRTKGEGSIIELPNGKCRVTLTLGYQMVEGKDGRPKKKQLRKTAVVDSKMAAVKTLKAFEKERDEGKLVPPTLVSVREMTQKFLEAKKRSVRASTYRLYDMAMREHINPTIGDYMLTDMTPDLVDELVAYWMADKDLNSMATIKTLRTILKGLFAMAEGRGLIQKNPVTKSSTVRVPHKEKRVLTQDEAQRLLEYAKKHGRGPIYRLLLLALATGMRRGELLGLCWDCVLDDKIRVWRNLIQTKEEGFKVDEPKTTAGRRTISVAPWVLEEIRALKNGSDWVFSWEGRDGCASFTTMMTEARRCLSEAGLEGVRFHDLRHTHATQLISEGVDIKSVSKRLGHENIKTTLDLYAHWLPENDQRAAEFMGAWLTPKDPQKTPEGPQEVA